jgi:signal transduction histidine kinase/CheY-like chemotaxis protein/HPt (histidine-containing phosphotransfer) domain-containing protein
MAHAADKLTLRTKATAAVAFVTLLALLAVAVSGVVQMRRLVAAEERQTVHAVAQGLGNASELALAVRDERELSRLAERFMRDDQVLLIAVYDGDDKLITKHTRTPELWERYRQAIDDKNLLYFSQPVTLGAMADEFAPASPATTTPATRATVGRVVVGLSRAPAIAALGQQTLFTALFTLLAAGASAAVVFLLVGTWTRRLNHLVVASERMSHGDFDHAIDADRADEIGRLSLSFENMRQAVRQRDSELRQFNSTLQEQVQDRTRSLQTALHEAQAADQAKSRFLATMSHEIRTPLNGVVGTVDLLRQTNLDENQRRYAQIAKSSADALLSVINDILDFSKIEAGRMELDAVTFALQDLVEDVTRTAALVAARKNLEMGCFVEPSVPEQTIGDSGRLRQILTNLLNNAIKFTEKGHIVVRAAVAKHAGEDLLVRFSVSDTGIGIPADRLDRLFQSFSQVDSSTTRKYGGSGLGLAISKRLAELMGGAIGVQSAVGRGSTFWFTVRLTNAGPVKKMPRQILPDMRRLRVIAVDDNAVNCEILQQQLSVWNLEGTTASSGPQALLMMREAAGSGRPFDLAILDWHMPGMDGLELAKAIRDCDILHGVKLIMLTSVEDQVCGSELHNLGFSGYLIKPVGQSQLFDTISSAFRKPARPPEKESAPAAASTPETAASTPPSRIHVLLAEDNEINQMVAAAILAKAGFTCDTVDNGIRAVAAAFTGRYDVVLMDCQMPEMDGFEAAREIRRREAETKVPLNARLPIVALTANAIKGDRELCLQAGMDDYVAKPIDHNKLCAAIQSAMARSRWRRASALPPGPSADAQGSAVAAPLTGTDSTSSGTRPTLPLGVSSAVARFLQSPADADAPLVPESTAPVDASPLNVSELCARCLNNVEFTQRILLKFQDRVLDDLASLTRTIASGKMEEATRLAHSLKGSAANLAAPAVRAVAAEIETLSRAGDAAQAEEALRRLRAEVERCLAYIPQAVASLIPVPPDQAHA